VNPQRFETFADAYAVAVLRAITDLGMHTGGRPVQDYALDATLGLLATIEANGLKAVEHYAVNTRGGAFRHTAEALGVDPARLQHYIDEVVK